MYLLFVVIFRYSAVRRQFGPPGKDEIPVLEYQMQVCFSLDMLSIIYTKNYLFNVPRTMQFTSYVMSIMYRATRSLLRRK